MLSVLAGIFKKVVPSATRGISSEVTPIDSSKYTSWIWWLVFGSYNNAFLSYFGPNQVKNFSKNFKTFFQKSQKMALFRGHFFSVFRFFIYILHFWIFQTVVWLLSAKLKKDLEPILIEERNVVERRKAKERLIEAAATVSFKFQTLFIKVIFNWWQIHWLSVFWKYLL